MIPTLKTDRLTLGPFDMTHFETFAAFRATDRSLYVGGPDPDRRNAWDSCMIHLGHWQARGYGAFFVTQTATGKPAGRISLWHPLTLDEPELSWILYDGFEGAGYAIEAALAVRTWATAQGLGPLQSLIDPANTRSIALAERLDCVREGTHSYSEDEVVIRYRHPIGATAQ